MRKLLLIAASSAMLAGCAGGYMARGDAGYAGDGYRTQTGSPSDWSRPYYNDRYWPPVDPNSAFPPQIMDGGSQD
jgi:hypothetical protein